MTKIGLTNRAKPICLNVLSVFLLAKIDSRYATETASTD